MAHISFVSASRISAPLEQIFAAITDVESFKHWVHNVDAVEKVTPGKVSVGTMFTCIGKVGSKIFADEYAVIFLESPTHIGFRIERDPDHSDAGEHLLKFELYHQPDHTLVLARYDAQLHGIVSSLITGFIGNRLRRSFERDLLKFKSFVESTLTPVDQPVLVAQAAS